MDEGLDEQYQQVLKDLAHFKDKAEPALGVTAAMAKGAHGGAAVFVSSASKERMWRVQQDLPAPDGSVMASMAYRETLRHFASEEDFVEQEEYERSYIGWGHTSMRDALQIGKSSGSKTVVFTHHDPNRSDDELDRLLGEYSEQLGKESGHSVAQLLGATERTTLKA